MDNTEILLYVERVKKFFETNEAARNYFLGSGSEELFFEKLIVMSKNNFKERGEPELFPTQFEEIREQILMKTNDRIFVKLINGYDEICLN